jgi:hypothetical protein
MQFSIFTHRSLGKTVHPSPLFLFSLPSPSFLPHRQHSFLLIHSLSLSSSTRFGTGRQQRQARAAQTAGARGSAPGAHERSMGCGSRWRMGERAGAAQAQGERKPERRARLRLGCGRERAWACGRAGAEAGAVRSVARAGERRPGRAWRGRAEARAVAGGSAWQAQGGGSAQG